MANGQTQTTHSTQAVVWKKELGTQKGAEGSAKQGMTNGWTIQAVLYTQHTNFLDNFWVQWWMIARKKGSVIFVLPHVKVNIAYGSRNLILRRHNHSIGLFHVSWPISKDVPIVLHNISVIRVLVTHTCVWDSLNLITWKTWLDHPSGSHEIYWCHHFYISTWWKLSILTTC